MASTGNEKSEGTKSESSGGIKSMLPLILNIVLLPVIAFVMTQFVLLPAINKAGAAAAKSGETTVEVVPGEHGGDSHGGAPGGGGGGGHDNPSGGSGGGHGAPAGSGGISTAMFEKAVTVNVAGTMGSRLMMAKIGIRGSNPNLKDMVKNREDDLRDAAASLLGTKTLMDLEKQGARNTIKAELRVAFLKVLGPGSFSEVVMPDLAIQ